MMTTQFLNKFENLKASLTAMCARSCALYKDAVAALRDLNGVLAGEVVERDTEIDHLEIEIQSQCQDLLTLQQPVAGDVRLIIASVRINTDLERIADQSVNIAEQVSVLAGRTEKVNLPGKLLHQSEIVQDMLTKMCGALNARDCQLARRIVEFDECVDTIHREMDFELAHIIRQQPENLDAMIALLKITRELERIADHAVNVCQEIIFIATGETIRHTNNQAID